MSKILELAKTNQNWGVKHRRYLHQHPELSNQEKNTSEYCQNIFKELGYKIKPCYGHGFIADLAGSDGKRTIAIRADMDALPVQEKNTYDFISKNPGVAHVCGHDVHMAIALTAAKLLAENPDLLKNNVRFIFQPCEEVLPGGAPGMIREGCLKGVDEIFALHLDATPNFKAGNIRVRYGACQASVDDITLNIQGKDSHAAKPHLSLDPIYAAANLIINWQGIISRRIDPTHAVIISITQIQSGNTYNVIPKNAEIKGTVRTFDKDDRNLIEKLIKLSVNNLSEQGYICNLDYAKGYPPVINHRASVDKIIDAAKEIVGIDNLDANQLPSGGADDFAYFLEKIPGAYYSLCSNLKGKEYPLHSADFDADENIIPVGAAMMIKLTT